MLPAKGQFSREAGKAELKTREFVSALAANGRAACKAPGAFPNMFASALSCKLLILFTLLI